MRRILKIISKDLKLLLRSRSSALIVILAPIFLIFLVGIAYDSSSSYNINIGVYSEDYNNFTRSFLNKLNEKQFNVISSPTEEICVNQMKLGNTHACLVFPSDLSIDRKETKNEIIFYIDYSKINLVWIILDTLSSKLASRTEELSRDLTNILLNQIEKTQLEVEKNKVTLSELKSENELINNNINDIKSDLDALDLSIDINAMHVSEIYDQNEENLLTYSKNQKAINSFVSDTRSRIKTIQTSFDIVVSNLEGLTNSNNTGANISESRKNYLISQIGQVLTNANTINIRTRNIENMTGYKFEHLRVLIFDLSKHANALKSNLETATTTREETITRIKEINGAISSSKKEIEDLQQSMDVLDESIGNIKVSRAEEVVSPVTTTIKPIISKETHLDYLFPGLIVLVIMFISILLGTTLVMMEKHSPAYFRNFITPTSDLIFTLATFLTNIFIVFVQALIILLISIIFFMTEILSNIVSIIILIFLITTLFSLIGMIMGYLFKSEETATLASISVGSLLLLMSDLILPIESMPRIVMEIAKFNPFVICENILKQVVLFDTPLSLTEITYFLGGYTVVINSILLLFIYILILFILVIISQNIVKKKFFVIRSLQHKKNKQKK